MAIVNLDNGVVSSMSIISAIVLTVTCTIAVVGIQESALISLNLVDASLRIIVLSYMCLSTIKNVK